MPDLRLLLRSHLVLTYGLLGAALVAPLAVSGADEGSDQRDVHLAAFSLMGKVFRSTSTGVFGSTESHPHAVPGGVGVLRVSLVLLVVGLVLCAVTMSTLLTQPEGRSWPALAAGTLLLVAGVGVWVGGLWLPELDGGDAGPSWGLWVPILAATWVLVHASTLRELSRQSPVPARGITPA